MAVYTIGDDQYYDLYIQLYLWTFQSEHNNIKTTHNLQTAKSYKESPSFMKDMNTINMLSPLHLHLINTNENNNYYY